MEKVRCPSCKEWSNWKNNPYRPFCSERCKDKDLGKWATEKYRVPVEEEDQGMTIPKKPDSDEDES